MHNQYKGYGNQSFNPGITIKEIAECLSKWNCKNVEQFNISTIINTKSDGRYVIAPYDLTQDGVEKKEVGEMWGWIQNMDKAAYDSLNWLLRDKMVLLIVPPPPPPPPPDDDN